MILQWLGRGQQGVGWLDDAMDSILGSISALWGVQHKNDGSHGAITADSLTLANASAGNVSGSLIPTTNNQQSLGAFPTTTPITPLVWKDLYLGSHLYLGIGSSGGLNPVAVPAWAVALGNTLTWQPPQSGQSIIVNDHNGSAKVTINPDSLLGTPLISATGISAGTTVNATTGFLERGRSTKLGEGQDVAYTAGNFTASSGTWTVSAGSQILYRYGLVGKYMTVSWEIDNTTVSGGQAQLRLAIPGGFLALNSVTLGGLVYSDNGGAFMSSGTMFTSAGSGFIGMQLGTFGSSTWSAATSTTSVRGVLTFEVQ